MVMTIRVMSSGKGYEYLLKSVVVGDGDREMSSPLTRYYTESGCPPGSWVGTGLMSLDDGRTPALAEGDTVTEEHLARLLGDGIHPVTGGEARQQVPLAATPRERIAARITRLDPDVRGEARAEAVQRIREEEVAKKPRTAVAGFDHYDSRAADPQLHTHVVVSNKAQGEDGRWRSLDSRRLHRATVALSASYNAFLADHTARLLGVTWVPADRGKDRNTGWEIDEYVAEHGRMPSKVTIARLRQQATLETRPEKELHSLADLTADWRASTRLIDLREDLIHRPRRLQPVSKLLLPTTTLLPLRTDSHSLHNVLLRGEPHPLHTPFDRLA